MESWCGADVEARDWGKGLCVTHNNDDEGETDLHSDSSNNDDEGGPSGGAGEIRWAEGVILVEESEPARERERKKSGERETGAEVLTAPTLTFRRRRVATSSTRIHKLGSGTDIDIYRLEMSLHNPLNHSSASL